MLLFLALLITVVRKIAVVSKELKESKLTSQNDQTVLQLTGYFLKVELLPEY